MMQSTLDIIAENKRTRNPVLNLGGCGLFELPSEVCECVWVKELILNDRYYDNDSRQWRSRVSKSKQNALDSLPAEIANLAELEILDLSFNEIDSLSFLRSLPKLHTLHLQNNQITDISHLPVLKHLKSLDLSHNPATMFSTLSELPRLQTLKLRYNRISDYSFLNTLTGLQHLDLSETTVPGLRTLRNFLNFRFLTNPQALYQNRSLTIDFGYLSRLKNLTHLSLSKNQISDIAPLKHLSQLEYLDLSENEISDISPLANLAQLKTLNLRFNDVSNPQSLQNLTSLETLDLGSNHSLRVRYLEDLVNLKSLSLSDIGITDLSFTANLCALQSLNLSENRVEIISPLAQLKNLRSLNVTANLIKDAQTIACLTSLEELKMASTGQTNVLFLKKSTSLVSLDISGNRIFDYADLKKLTKLRVLEFDCTDIPNLSFLRLLSHLETLKIGGAFRLTDINRPMTEFEVLRNLTALKTLTLPAKNISDIQFLSQLSNLEYLDLSNNQISEIGKLKSLLNFQHIRHCNLDKNPVINKLPAEVRDAGWEAVKDWLSDELSNSTVLINEVKLLFLGNTSSGKSTLLEYFDKGVVPRYTGSTFGIQYKLLNILPGNININCWDFGGQEYFHATHQLFFSPGALHLVLWNRQEEITKHIREADCFELDYWFRCIEQLLNQFTGELAERKKTEVIVCENKLQLDNNVAEITPLNQALYAKMFPNLNFEYKHINLIPEITTYLAALKDSIMVKAGSLCNKHSIGVTDYLAKIRNSSRPYMKISEFGNGKSEVLKARIRVIRNMGIVIYFENILPDIVFTKPQLLLDLLYDRILGEKLQRSRQPYKIGLVALDNAVMYNNLDLHCKDVIKLLKYFNLVFETAADPYTYFIPQYMPEKSVEDLYALKRNFHKPNIFVSSDYYLMNVAMLKIYSKYGTNVKTDNETGHLFWKDGLMIDKNDTTLLIILNRKQQQIELYPSLRGNSIPLEKEIVEFVFSLPIDSNAETESQKEKNRSLPGKAVHWKNKFFDVYIGDSSGYLMSWPRLFHAAKLGLEESVGYLNGKPDDDNEIGQRIPIYSLRDFLPPDLRINEPETMKNSSNQNSDAQTGGSIVTVFGGTVNIHGPVGHGNVQINPAPGLGHNPDFQNLMNRIDKLNVYEERDLEWKQSLTALLSELPAQYANHNADAQTKIVGKIRQLFERLKELKECVGITLLPGEAYDNSKEMIELWHRVQEFLSK